MDELFRLSELTHFAELPCFVYVSYIILTFRLHGKRVVPLWRDPVCRMLSYSFRRDENSHVIAFYRVTPAKRVEESNTFCFKFENERKYTRVKLNRDTEMLFSYLSKLFKVLDREATAFRENRFDKNSL